MAIPITLICTKTAASPQIGVGKGVLRTAPQQSLLQSSASLWNVSYDRDQCFDQAPRTAATTILQQIQNVFVSIACEQLHHALAVHQLTGADSWSVTYLWKDRESVSAFHVFERHADSLTLGDLNVWSIDIRNFSESN